MYCIFAAKENNIADINRIAYESEAYWGYNSEYMERFKEIYRITEDYIKAKPTFILVEGNHIIGFYSLVLNGKEAELELFYSDPQNIGKGYGKKMWGHLISYCKREGIKSLSLVANPQAKGFYEKMGAVMIDQVESRLRTGRKIPRLMFEIVDA